MRRRPGAADALPNIVDEIRLVPQGAALATWRSKNAAAGGADLGIRSRVSVAGARNCLYLLLFAGRLFARSHVPAPNPRC
jgi:hypothetical protein